jgi:hypothetical protein
MQYLVSGVPAGAIPVTVGMIGGSGCAAAAAGKVATIMLKAPINISCAILFLLERQCWPCRR